MLRVFRHRHSAPVFVCSLDQAGELATRVRASLLVSIADPERRNTTQERIGKLRAHVLPLDFHDIERDAPDMTCPASHHVASALEAASQASMRRPILVHCHAGISRSSAFAIVLAASRHLSSGRSQGAAIEMAFSQVCAATPHARPNMRVIELGGAALDLPVSTFADRAWDLHRGTL